MSTAHYDEELLKCVRCGACKSICPTYLTTLNESMGARGRVALLGELSRERLAPTKVLADKIYSCMLCGACKNLCPTGINIPEVIYKGRALLKDSYGRGRFLRRILKHLVFRLDFAFSVLRYTQKILYPPLYRAGVVNYVPEITSKPFKKNVQVYKNVKKIGRVAVFAGCSVNYLYPKLGQALTNVLLFKGYEVVVFKGELCCGAPLRSAGLEEETVKLAERNIEHFNKVRASAIISMCPTCTMVVKEHYPMLTGNTISNIMDINEFLINNNLTDNLEVMPQVITYHDPCHLRYGMEIRDEPRQIIKGIKGIEFVEMSHAQDCCGFAGLFSIHYRNLAREIGRQKAKNISDTDADTVVTSCPGCIMQLEAMKKELNARFSVKHVIEVIQEGMKV